MIILKSLLSGLILYTTVIAQVPNTEWTKTFGGPEHDEGYSVQQTQDGGYIIVANQWVESNPGNPDVWIIKTDSAGDTLWTKTYGGDKYDLAYSVLQTDDGGYVIGGLITPFNPGNEYAWIFKTDAAGEIEWTHTFGDSATKTLTRHLQPTEDGGYIMTGVTREIPVGQNDVFLIRTDADGNLMWRNTFGGTEYEEGRSVQQTTDGGYIITGETESFGAGETDVYLIKTDAGGGIQWSKTFGGIYDDIGNSVIQCTDGGYIITGATESFGSGGYSLWLIKTNASGDSLWSKTIGGIHDDQGNSIIQTLDGDYIITGLTGSFGPGNFSLWLIKTDSVGDTLWTKTFGKSLYPEIGHQVQQTNDDGYIIVGETSSYGNGREDVYLIKIAPDITAIEETSESVIDEFRLAQNYPNPFNPNTTIKFSIPTSSSVTLKVYDILGNEVATLVDEFRPAGTYESDFNSHSGLSGISELTSGIYFYQLKAEDFSDTKKMIFLK